MAEFIRNPGGVPLLGDFLKRSLLSDEWSEFRAAVAFVKQSGAVQISEELGAFSAANNLVKIVAGVDLLGTSEEGLRTLLKSVEPGGEVWIFHNEGGPTFHPKVYVFSNEGTAELLVGSGNLTESGLFRNYEAALLVRLDLTSSADRALYDDVISVLEGWCSPEEGTAKKLTEELLQGLIEKGYVNPEARSKSVDSSEENGDGKKDSQGGLFSGVSVPHPPRPPKPKDETKQKVKPVAPRARGQTKPGIERNFVMTLQRTDAGVGQTTPGKSKRSPEIFIPLAALDMDPGFWKYPDRFQEDKARKGKLDRWNVPFRFRGAKILVNLFRNPTKHDLRIRSGTLRDAANEGDILHLALTDGKGGIEYEVEIASPGTGRFETLAKKLTESVRPPSKKKFGYY